MKRFLTGIALAAALTVSAAAEACENAYAMLDGAFEGARMSACEPEDRNFVVTIDPENTPINPSPWYAFRVTPKQTGAINVIIRYSEAQHRYRPKLSEDGKSWRRLDASHIRERRKGKKVTLRLDLGTEPFFVAAQELLRADDYERWIEAVAARVPLTVFPIGESVEGRPLMAIESTPETERPNKEFVLFMGRQHPPEVTGALAMLAFLEMVFSDTPLARDFRARFHVIAVPLLNPDGVVRGHWRHNVNGIDLNRDWGPFTQPETQAVKAILDEIAADPNSRLRLMLDFHSTRRNVFYTQANAEPTDPPAFTLRWLAAARERLAGYEFEHAERPLSKLTTAKNYTYRRFGVPAITYEIGDRTDRAAIRASTVVFAQEMMETLLGYNP